MKVKSGYVALIGKPNVGKSTLLNGILGEKLSITTHKPQTTRKRIMGILDAPEYQIIFLDTPGILTPSYLLQEKLLDYVSQSVADSDVIVFIIDASVEIKNQIALEDEYVREVFQKFKKSKIAIINKIDLVNQQQTEKLISKLTATELFDDVIPISASENMNVKSVLNKLIELLPEGPKYYPEDQLTDEPEKFFVSEIIRENIFEQYRDEVPYSTEVLIEQFKERDGRKDYISAAIVVERESQKPIIIGKRGEAIKKLGKLSRESIEEFLQREVFLELRVKVRENWRSNKNMLKSYGYITGNE